VSITTLLFDFGGVILTSPDSDEADQRRDRLAGRLGMANGEELMGRFFAGPEWLLTRVGEMTEAQMWQEILEPYGLSDSGERREFVAEAFAGEGVQPDMLALIRSLHGRLPLGILSNASDTLEQRLEDLAIADYFYPVINSHRIGVAKPDEQAFQIAIDRLGVPPERILFIDDRQLNTEAADALGMRTHLFRDVPLLEKELRDLEIL